MKIKVKFFALYRQLAGKEEITLQLPPDTIVSKLEAKLLEDYPRIKNSSLKPLVAVNAEYAGHEQVLKDGDVVAILPPFSGGIYT